MKIALCGATGTIGGRVARGQLEQLRILQHNATPDWTFISPAPINARESIGPKGDQLTTDGTKRAASLLRITP